MQNEIYERENKLWHIDHIVLILLFDLNKSIRASSNIEQQVYIWYLNTFAHGKGASVYI